MRPNETLMRRFIYITLLALYAVTIQSASASDIVAIVEDSEGNTGDVQLFDMLEVGREIEIGAGGRLVLGYLRSCWRETIAGGKVTIRRAAAGSDDKSAGGDGAKKKTSGDGE